MRHEHDTAPHRRPRHRGAARMAFRRDGKVFYFPSINAKSREASAEIAATWEDC